MMKNRGVPASPLILALADHASLADLIRQREGKIDLAELEGLGRIDKHTVARALLVWNCNQPVSDKEHTRHFLGYIEPIHRALDESWKRLTKTQLAKRQKTFPESSHDLPSIPFEKHLYEAGNNPAKGDTMTNFKGAGIIRKETDDQKKVLIEELVDELSELVVECIDTQIKRGSYSVTVKVKELNSRGVTVEVPYEVITRTVNALRLAGYLAEFKHGKGFEGYEIDIRWDKAQYPPEPAEPA
jgi:hypothetical protein